MEMRSPLCASDRVVVVGGGVAGARAVAALRELGFCGAVDLVCEEARLPYDRPPLSKACLTNGAAAGLIPLHSADFYRDHAVTVHLGARAVAIDRRRRWVTMHDGSALPYDRLILATGGKARRPTFVGQDLPGVLVLRTADDALDLAERLKPGARVAILGGGLIGLEVAAAARQRGCGVVILELAPRLASRVAAPSVSEALAALHVGHGVEIRCEARLGAAHGEDRLRYVTLGSGERLPCDVLVLATGVTPATDLAETCGLEVHDGVLCDAAGRTSDNRIFAVGDVACAFHPALGRHVRLECWESARQQAFAAASALCGVPAPAMGLPWAWSEQYELNLQLLGVLVPALDIVTRRRGADPELIAFGVGDERISHVSALGRVADFAAARRLADSRAVVSATRLQDPNTSLRALLPARPAAS